MTALEARKLAEDEMKAGKTPKYTDLRDWLEIVDSVGELKKIDGVDWNLEMGTLAEIFARETKSGSAGGFIRQRPRLSKRFPHSVRPKRFVQTHGFKFGPGHEPFQSRFGSRLPPKASEP
jgi:hypothetical protein